MNLKSLESNKPSTINCLSPLASNQELAEGKGWSPLVDILQESRAQTNIKVDISDFLQDLISLEIKQYFTPCHLSFLKANSSFLSLKRIATAYTDDSAVLATNLRKAANLYFAS